MRHIGLIVAFQSADLRGYFCKDCFMKSFWRYTLVTFFFGWWGLVSFFLTPIVLVNNLILLCRSFGLHPKRPDAVRPKLFQSQINLLEKIRDRLRQRLAAGENEEALSLELSRDSGVTPAQAFMLVSSVAGPTGR
jgi:hypothetical protein